MAGTILNAIGILAGGIFGLMSRRQLSTEGQIHLKAVLGLLTILVGLYLTWSSLGGGVWSMGAQVLIWVLALTLGRITGRVLRLQKLSNRLGQLARQRMENAKPGDPERFNHGFLVGAVLFCAAPLALVGAMLDGLAGRWYVLGIKAVLDGLATMAFVRTFSWGAIWSVIPVMAFQGTIALATRWLAIAVLNQPMIDATVGIGGLLVFCTAMLMLNLRRIEVADYLPSLLFAPLLTWLFR